MVLPHQCDSVHCENQNSLGVMFMSLFSNRTVVQQRLVMHIWCWALFLFFSFVRFPIGNAVKQRNSNRMQLICQ